MEGIRTILGGEFYGKPLELKEDGLGKYINYTDIDGEPQCWFPCEEDWDILNENIFDNKDVLDKVTELGTTMESWDYPIYNIPTTNELENIANTLEETMEDYEDKCMPCDVLDSLNDSITSLKDAISRVKELKLIRSIPAMVDKYKDEHHWQEPLYAYCGIRYHDEDKDKEPMMVTIKLKEYNEETDKKEDDEIFFYCSKGVSELQSLCVDDNLEDFKVTSVEF